MTAASRPPDWLTLWAVGLVGLCIAYIVCRASVDLARHLLFVWRSRRRRP